MKIRMEIEDRTAMYNDYLDKHISGVKRAYNEILKDYLLTETSLTVEELCKLDNQIDNHDQSKYSADEWNAYLDHFYPDPIIEYSTDNSKAYDLAWLHHQKSNSHHWQYWILVKDNPEDGDKYVPLEMDIFSVCEMLCDWSSFQYTHPGSTANKWYKDNKDQIILNDKTRELVEEILKALPML